MIYDTKFTPLIKYFAIYFMDSTNFVIEHYLVARQADTCQNSEKIGVMATWMKATDCVKYNGTTDNTTSLTFNSKVGCCVFNPDY